MFLARREDTALLGSNRSARPGPRFEGRAICSRPPLLFLVVLTVHHLFEFRLQGDKSPGVWGQSPQLRRGPTLHSQGLAIAGSAVFFRRRGLGFLAVASVSEYASRFLTMCQIITARRRITATRAIFEPRRFLIR